MKNLNQKLSRESEEAVEILVASIEGKLKNTGESLVVALDGRSGTGKTTIAKSVAEKLGDAVIIVGDNFYTGGENEDWNRITAKEKYESCIDWKRIRKEALEPLRAGKPAKWHPFDWDNIPGRDLSQKFIKAKPARVIILDIVYSARPELEDIVDFTVLLQVGDAERRKRLKKREGLEFMEKWHKVWDEAEDYYFSQIRTPKDFDLVVSVK